MGHNCSLRLARSIQEDKLRHLSELPNRRLFHRLRRPNLRLAVADMVEIPALPHYLQHSDGFAVTNRFAKSCCIQF